MRSGILTLATTSLPCRSFILLHGRRARDDVVSGRPIPELIRRSNEGFTMHKLTRAGCALLITIFCTLPALAQQNQYDTGAYLVDSSNQPVRSGSGLCWHTGTWNASAATLECDPELVLKPAMALPPKPIFPMAVPPMPPGQRLSIKSELGFEAGKALFRPEDKAVLDQVATRARDMNLEAVTVIAHADRIEGKDSKVGQALADRRAALVREYLKSRGVNPALVQVESKGANMPRSGQQCAGLGKDLVNNAPLVKCLGADRRAEIEVIGFGVPAKPNPRPPFTVCMAACDKEQEACISSVTAFLQGCAAVPGMAAVDCKRWRSNALFECDAAVTPCKAQCNRSTQ